MRFRTVGMAVIALALLAITCPSVHAALLTFTLYNTSASQASTVCKRVGVAFEPGDIPSGYQVGVRVQGGADVYGALLNVKKYPDGSLWAGTLAVHDTNDIPAGGSRTYEVYSKAGNPPTSSWDSWSWITSNASDFTVDLTAHSGASSGSLPNRTYSLKTAIGTTTRREVSDNTQVLKRIYVWQKVSGEEHLICLFYVDFWLNTGGTAPIAVEYTPVMSQHWWKANPFGTVQTKEARTYNAAVKYGSTSLDSRTGLAHAYHCRWASLRSASDDQHACRHWIDLGNDPMPTLRLEYLSDAKSKLIKSGVIPPYNVLDNSTLALTSTYTPLGLNGHRAGISSTGAYDARGLLGRPDCFAWQQQTAQRWREARVMSQAGLSAHFHYRDSRAAGSDVSAGLIPNIMSQLATQTDYTGLAPRTTAVTDAAYPGAYPFDPPYGNWPYLDTDVSAFFSYDTAHATDYSYFMAFTEGEAYLADAVRSACDMTTRPDHYNTYGANPPLFYWGWTLRRTQMGIPSTAYGQIPYLTGQIRQGLAVLPLAKAFMVTPDTDRHTPYFKDYMTYLAKYFADAYVYFPASQKAKGTFFPGPLLPGGHDYWMDVLSGMSCYMLWNIGDKASLSVAGIKTAAEQSALAIINCMKYSPGVAAEYTQCELDAENGYTYLPPDKNYVSFDCSVAGNVVSLSETSKNNAPFATNDEAMFVPYPSGSLKGKPSQISFFQHLWVRDVSGNTFKLAATQGGAALTLDAGTNYGITVRQVSSENQTTWNQYGSNSYATEDFLDQSHCLFELARFFGHPAIDAALGTKADTFFAGRVPQDWPTWDIDSKVLTGGDTTAPAAVSNLATSSPTSSSITLTWMAPGDDGSTGTATSYDIRYRTGGSVNDSNWASATQVTGEPAPAVAGTNQSMVVNNLTAGTTYYFAIKTSDEAPNTSAISNSPSGTTTSGGGGGGVLALKRDSGLLQGGAIDARFSGLSSATLVTVRDAGLYNSSNARYYNYGTSTLAQNSYSVIKFDLSTYTGRTVNLAQLRVRCTAGNNTMQWAGVKSHDWSEGNKNGTYPGANPSAPGVSVAHPNGTQIDATGPLGWGSGSNAYLDFTSNGADLYAATNFTSYPGGAAWAVADVTSLVQDWLSGTKANYGVVLLQGNHPVNMSEIGTDYEPVLFLDVAGGDTTAPAAVTNLATSSPTTNSITLTWTAPGDDGSTGTATTYDIRYRTGGAVNDSNWASATQVTGEPTPAAAGTNQSMVVNGLLAGTTYYFAIKTSDEVPNTSAISNSPSGTTTSAAVTVALKRDSGLLQGGAIDARFSGLSSATLVTVNDAKLYNSGNARYYNYGTSTLADQSYSVIKFDLSAYTGRTVNLAQLRVRCTAGNITMQWAGVKSHDWSEGNKNGNYPGISPSAPGVSVAHPNGTHTDTTGPLGWGSGSNAMLDFTSNGQDLYAVTNFTSYPGGVAWAVADLTSLVQEWLSGTKANYGVLLLEGNHPVNMSEIGTDYEPVLFLDLN